MSDISSEQPPRLSFDQQIESSKQNFALFGTTVDVVRARPVLPKSKTPVVVNPSWGTTIDLNKRAMQKLYESGREVVSFNHIRDGEENMDPFARQTETLETVVGRSNLPPVDIFTHSSGFLSSIDAALAHPERYKNIVTYGPVGLGGYNNFPDFVKSFVKSGTEEVLHAAQESSQKLREVMEIRNSEVSYAAKNIGRAIEEMKGISEAAISQKLLEVRKKGIGVVIILGSSDKGIEMDRVQRVVTAEMVDGLLTVKGTHDSHLIHPEQIMPLVDSVLTARETGMSIFK